MGYARSFFWNFASNFRTGVELDGDDDKMVSKQVTSQFITCGSLPGFSTNEDPSEVLGLLRIKKGPCKWKMMTFVWKQRSFWLSLVNLWNVKLCWKLFSNIFLGFTPYWDYKPTNDYIGKKNCKFEYKR